MGNSCVSDSPVAEMSCVKVSDGVCIAGPVSDDAISSAVASLGVKSLLNLVTPGEAAYRDRSALAASLKIAYKHLPVSIPSLNHGQMDKYLASLDAAPKPVLVLCASGLRAALLSTVHEQTRGTAEQETFIKKTCDVGVDLSTRAELMSFIRDYIDRKRLFRTTLPTEPVEVKADIKIASQPSEAQLKEWAAAGVKSIINLRNVEREQGFLGLGVLAREKELVEGLGMKYTNVPTTNGRVPSAAEIKTVQDAIAALPKPLVVHCLNMERSAYATGHKAVPQKVDITKPLRGKPLVHCIPHMDTATCCFIVSCPETKMAMIVDPVLDFDHPSGTIDHKHADLVIDYVKKNGLQVVLLLETHAHADHLTSMQYLKEKLGALTAIGSRITEVQTVFGGKFNIDEKEMPRTGVQWDILYDPYQEWSLGNIQCVTIPTPGHTPACMSHIVGDTVFVGDTIFMQDIGTARCDFPGGSVDDMWNSVQLLFTLPDATRTFVGHDYPTGGRPFRWETTVAEQKAENKMVKVGTKKEDFITLRRTRDAGLGAPRLLLPSIQVNIRGGALPLPEDNKVNYLKTPLTEKTPVPNLAVDGKGVTKVEPAKIDITKPLRGKPLVHCIPHMDTATCCFIVSCPETKKAMIVDPVLDYDQPSGTLDVTHSNLVLDYVKEHGLQVELLLETHAHADHLTSTQYLKEKLGAQTAIGSRITEVQTVFGGRFNIDEKEMPRTGVQWDVLYEPYQEWSLGNIQCVSIPTPGHTPACMGHIVGDAAFVGDTIFMQDIGTARCDFPGGSVDDMWNSVQLLFTLPDTTRVFVGHDYPSGGRPFRWETTIAEQKAENKMVKVGTKKEDFITLRRTRDAGLGAPRLLLPSIQVNIRAGRLPVPESNLLKYLKTPVTIKL